MEKRGGVITTKMTSEQIYATIDEPVYGFL
jgi:hypothetical protein